MPWREDIKGTLEGQLLDASNLVSPGQLTGLAFEAASALADDLLRAPDGASLLQFEQRMAVLGSYWAASMVGAILKRLLASTALRATLTQTGLAATTLPVRPSRYVPVTIRLLGGLRVQARVQYFEPKRSVPARKRSRHGCYPVLQALAVHQRCTPALVSEVARTAVRLSSFEEARADFARRGCHLDEKTIHRLTNVAGQRALDDRQAAREAPSSGKEFAGKKVMIAIDGGRARTRVEQRKGRRLASGRRRFDTDWREVKMFALCVLDEGGRIDRDYKPVYQATLGNADEVFALLEAEIKARGIDRAETVVFSADGADWIWDRIDKVAESAGLDGSKVWKVLDFYHAVEYLAGVIEAMKMAEDTRRLWIRDQRRLLKKGQVEEVIKQLEQMIRWPRRRKKKGARRRLETGIAYLTRNAEKMRYSAFKQAGIPRGSGLIESAIRRVVNLRIKGPGIFWRPDNVERFLILRCYYKAGRWDELIERALLRLPQDPHDQRLPSAA